MEHINAYNARDFDAKKTRIIEKCLAVIEEEGVNAYDAQCIPYHLQAAIFSSNREAQGQTPFKVYLTEEERLIKDWPQSCAEPQN